MNVGTLDQVVSLAQIAFNGLFSTDFTAKLEWYEPGKHQRNARSVMEHHFGAWCDLGTGKATLPLIVTYGGRVVGTQGLSARSAPYLASREFSSGSWLDRSKLSYLRVSYSHAYKRAGLR